MSACSVTQKMTEDDTLSGQQNLVSWNGNIGDKHLKLVESNKLVFFKGKDSLQEKWDWRTCLREKLLQTEPVRLLTTVKAKARCRRKRNNFTISIGNTNSAASGYGSLCISFFRWWMGEAWSFKEKRINGGNYLVDRIDRSALPFEAKAWGTVTLWVAWSENQTSSLEAGGV